MGEEIRKLLALLPRVENWGETNGWPEDFSDFPQYKEIQFLGEKINKKVGHDGMRAVCHLIHGQSPKQASLLNHLWEGIGGWRP